MKTLITHNHTFAQTCPLLLADAECANPYLVIEEFFNYSSPIGYSEELSTWFSAALNEEVRHDSPSHLVFIHNQFLALLNAGFLVASTGLNYQPDLSSNKETFSKFTVRHNAPQTKETKASSLTSPYWIRRHQREELFTYITETFTVSNIINLRYGMKEWLSAALSDELSIQDMGHKYSFELYEELQKIIEACYFLMIADKKLNKE